MFHRPGEINFPGSNINAATRRFATQTRQAQFGVPGPINQAQPNADPQNQTAASLFSFNTTARIVFGVVTDVTSIANAYRVQLEKHKQPVVAYLAPRTSCNIFGARELTTLLPGTQVQCIWHEQLSVASIIAVSPPVGIDGRLANHSIISGATRQRDDTSHSRPLEFEKNGRIPSFTAGRPFDATNAGEVGWITETGMRVFLDSFMAAIGGEESCQLSFFHHDMLARLAAYNFQLWTACREHESFNDQDETMDWTGFAMYPWENLGLAQRADGTKINSADEWQNQNKHYFKMEPIDDYMMPWHREREFHGYLGQGGKRCLVAPPIEFEDLGDAGSIGNTEAGEGNRTSNTSYVGGSGTVGAQHPGLFDSFVTADGRWCVQSAKGISLVKRSTIILPTRKQRPEDNNGDNPDNYKFSGILGEGPDHSITGDIATSGDNKAFNRAAGILDLHAYMFNYAGLHPFFYHAEDYEVKEESETTWADGKSAEVPDYGKLAAEAYIDAEDYKKTWDIDHRYGESDFYTLSCGFELLEDGGVVISDGYGGTIRMCGGSIEISAPGDIWFKSGRNVNSWAGRDAVIRAKNSVDVTASNKDVRIKAEKNLMVLGGNGGEGGVLVESRGASPELNFDECGEEAKTTGIILRSQNAPIATWTNSLFLHATDNGVIMLDADNGNGNIMTYADSVNNYLGSGFFGHFNVTGEASSPQVEGPSFELSEGAASFPGTACIKGSAIVDGPGIFNGSLAVIGGVAATSGAPDIAQLEGEARQNVEEQIQECSDRIETDLPDIGQSIISGVTSTFYEANRVGDSDIILKGEVSLRVQTDYKTENFILYEDRWQQLGRITGKASATWQETPVTCLGQQTYPYPGREAFESGSNFVQQDLNLFDANEGQSKDRGTQPELSDEYAEPSFAEPNKVSLNNYTVIS